MPNTPPQRAIRRVLIANRGEIAVRIIRACRELGLETVQAYSEADRHSLAVRLADQAICIGPAPAKESYLDPERLIGAAAALDVDAVHPGYGFLSERADFAEQCESAGFAFVGPRPEAIRAMGDKASARKIAAQAGVPTTPGSSGVVSGLEEARAIAQRVGYPVILKASAGGGGRGMRIVWAEQELEQAFTEAAREARSAFGDDSIYVEKYLTRIRHIEVQVLSDGDTVLHLGERDCSVQRRNQKLVEEGPSPALDEVRRKRIGEAAVRLCREVGYRSAGTVECILDEESGEFYFMEMNTRIQVEHPVTEMITGVDLVKAQLRIATGERLPWEQQDIRIEGHAIECRINAEDVDNQFMPSPGLIRSLRLPGGPGVRVDTHVFADYVVPPNYDSLLAKVIVWGRDRDEAVARCERALSELELEGIKTTVPFCRRLLAHPLFRQGNVHTRFLPDVMGL